MTRRRTVGVGLLAAAALSVAIAATYLVSPERFHADAARIVASCKDAADRALCYDKEVPKLMDGGYSMEDAFKVVAIVQDLDPSYTFCHVLGHILSEKETAKDPSKWVEVVHRAPTGICSNGAIHGAFQERFRTESLPDAKVEELKPILLGVCRESDDWHPTRLEQASCTHALGHLAMYITAANAPRSLAICDAVALNEGGYDFRQLCYDGVFMQLYQPLEPEDFDLIAGKEITVQTRDSSCREFAGRAHASCITESWPLYRETLFTSRALLDFCGVLGGDSEQYDRCFRGLTYVMTSQFNFDESRITPVCGGLPMRERGVCFANAAGRMVETDTRYINRAASMCARAAEHEVGEACYQELIRFSTYNFAAGSRQSHALCAVLPPPYRQACEEQQ